MDLRRGRARCQYVVRHVVQHDAVVIILIGNRTGLSSLGRTETQPAASNGSPYFRAFVVC